MKPLKLMVCGCAVALLILTVSACGGSGSSSSSSSSGSSSTGESTSAGTSGSSSYLTNAEAALAKLYAGTDEEPPSTGPAAEGGKNVWEISCAESAEGCHAFSEELEGAAQKLGWTLHVFDGNFNANGAYSTGIRQAVAAGADGIILNGIDCAEVTQPLKEAEAQSVVTLLASAAFNCQSGVKATGAVMPTKALPTPEKWSVAWGENKADWTIAKLGGEGEVLNVTFTGVPHVKPLNEGFEKVMSTCSKCTVNTLEVTLGDLSSNGLVEKMSAALVQSPDVKAVVVPYDNLVTQGVIPALKQAGLIGESLVLGGEGLASNIVLIEKGEQTADIAYDTGWTAWGAADSLNRLFAGEEPVPEGFGFAAVEEGHNMPTGDRGFESKVDYRSAYEKVWNGQ